jgi:hypothetical protein
MSNQIDIILALKSADALAKLNTFVNEAGNSIKRLAEEAVAAWLSVEGIHKVLDFEKDALKLEESIGKLSKVTGLSVDMLVAMRTAATASGTPFDQLTASLGKFSQMVYEAATSGGKAEEAFRQMGVSLKNQDGTLRAMDDIFRDFVTKFGQMPDGAQKTAFAMQIMGRSARESVVMLNDASEAMDKMRNEGSPITDESVAQATAFNRSLRELHKAVEDIFIEAANRLLPALREISAAFSEASRSADAHHAIIESLVFVFKSVVTAVVIAGAAFYDLGKFIGEDANLLVDNFSVAIQTAKALLHDLADLLIDEVRLFADLAQSVVALGEAVLLAKSGHLIMAKDIVAAQFASLKSDVTTIAGDIGNAVSDVFTGVQKGMQNTLAMTASFSFDVLQQWNSMSGFLKDLWGETGKPAPKASASTGPSIVPVSQTNLKDLSTLQGILSSIYKQQQDLINSDPFKSQAEKLDELMPLLEKQKDLIYQEYAAARSKLDTNLSETQRLAVMKDLVKLQGELNNLETQQQKIMNSSSFASQFKIMLAQMRDAWGTWATQIASSLHKAFDGAVSTISSNLTAVIMQTKTWGQALNNIGTSILTSIVEAIIKMGVQWVATQLMMLVSGTAMASSGVAASAPIAAAQAALWATPATLATISSYGAAADEAPGLIAIAEAATAMESMFRERGGPVTSGRPYIVGEKRPELFVPDSNGTILPTVPSTVASGATGAASSPVNLHFHGGEAEAMKAIRSTEGQNYIVNLNRRNVRRIARV